MSPAQLLPVSTTMCKMWQELRAIGHQSGGNLACGKLIDRDILARYLETNYLLYKGMIISVYHTFLQGCTAPDGCCLA